MQEIVGIGVFGKTRRHRTNDGDFVNMLCDVRKQLADRHTARSIRLKLPRAGECVSVVVDLSVFDLHLERLTVLLLQSRFWIKSVYLGRSTIHVEVDHVAA